MLALYGLLAVTFVLLIVYLGRSKKRLPPGPRGLPIIGNLLSINPKTPHESLAKIAWEHGPVCGLYMGSVYTVLLSDPKLVRQLFAKDTFSGRAPLYLTHGIMKGYESSEFYAGWHKRISWRIWAKSTPSGDGTRPESGGDQNNSLIASEGELWRDQRKFVSACLKNFGMVKFPSPKRDQLEKKILVTVDEAVEKLEARSRGAEGLDSHSILHHCIGNLMNGIVFGKVYDEDDELWKWFQHIQEEGVKHIGVSGPLNFLPFLRFLPRYGNTIQLIVDGQNKTHQHYRKILEDHRKFPTEMNSFLATYDEEMKRRMANGEPLASFTETQCFYLLADLYGAGVDTTLTTLRWFLLFMAAFPDEQAKIQEEISNVVGEKEPNLEDRPSMPRLEAAIMEVQRLRSVVPIGIPHGTTEDTHIGDYDVPKGSMIVPFQWAIHLNPLYWSDPRAFKPQRFIAEDGGLAKPAAFLPFQNGKRMCVGDELARMILILFAARILHRLKLSAPPGQTVDLEGDCGITLVPKPQTLLFKSRR
ncbi:cytochrome P450 306a1 isoform X2 [Nasonia vitripennis]|uniref:Cytochrome P450 306a1 n=1 Tax=Nasonia vitripennis TaxID=7425 RepID=A0A7M7Q8G3_NASVI|nr:cytochrome P450 306a1 isoform X2 [Nasonia vitripennis]XP_032457656.1 cytochrome P450 306a1 isoform X2 [Nasonia vitripennis]